MKFPKVNTSKGNRNAVYRLKKIKMHKGLLLYTTLKTYINNNKLTKHIAIAYSRKLKLILFNKYICVFLLTFYICIH